MNNSKTLSVIGLRHEEKQGTGFREHLGASFIGRECARSIWYTFRWSVKAHFKARILRLFERGQREEPAILKLLRQAGIHAVDVDPKTGKQFRITDHDGHMGGSLDAKLFDTPDFPNIWVLAEFKTHNDKSFKALKEAGLEESKPEHIIQMQLYMHYTSLPNALYFAINKNDDDIEVLTVEYDASVAERFINRAHRIIYAKLPPPRISESPAWYKCRWCDHKEVCHFDAKKAFNCRTCINAQPIHDAQWHCQHFDVILNSAAQRTGCQQYVELTED